MISKVVFVDIDGPMNPATMYLVNPHCSLDRKFPPTTIAVLNRLCEATGAKVVFNTTHNVDNPAVANIDEAIVAAGLHPRHINYGDHKTDYPDVDRDQAVSRWLARNPHVTEWVAIDDHKFTDDPRLVLVDPDAGVHVGHLNDAIKILGGKPFLVLI